MSEKRYDEDNQEALDEWKSPQEVSLKRAEKHRASNQGGFRLFRKNNKHNDLAGDEMIAPAVEEQAKADVPIRKKAPLWARMLFWIVRKSIAPLIMIVMLLAGLYVGYVIMGDQPKDEAFKLSTYKHLWDLIFAES